MWHDEMLGFIIEFRGTFVSNKVGMPRQGPRWAEGLPIAILEKEPSLASRIYSTPDFVEPRRTKPMADAIGPDAAAGKKGWLALN